MSAWTSDEYDLIEHSDMSVNQIAEILGRSPQSVYQKRYKLRRGERHESKQWTPDEIATIKETGHLPASEVAKMIGRTTAAVGIMRQKQGVRGSFRPEHRANNSPHAVGPRPLVAKTCHGCGLLLGAKWFHKQNHATHPYWRSICRKCDRPGDAAVHRAAARRYQDACQAQTLPGASRNGFPWLGPDHAVLSDPSLTVLRKAILLHRTYLATQRALRVCGYVSAPWLGSSESEQWIIDNPNAARLLARSEVAA